MYPSEWIGNAENANGIAKFKIEGLDFSIRLQCFADYLMLSNMLDLVFSQGKGFAEQAIRSHIIRAMDNAKNQHAL